MPDRYVVRQTGDFAHWLRSLDPTTRGRVLVRIARIELGNTGADGKQVGEGVRELRLHFGPGYRIYFVLHDRRCVILLAGGDKGSQQRDIALAKRMARELREKDEPP